AGDRHSPSFATRRSSDLWRSLRAGIPAERIVFSGVGKSAREIVQGLDAGVARFNVESRDELELLQAVAAQRGTTARAAVRINPRSEEHTSELQSREKLVC